MRERVMIIADVLTGQTGAARSVRLLANGLDERGYLVSCVPTEEAPDAVRDAYRPSVRLISVQQEAESEEPLLPTPGLLKLPTQIARQSARLRLAVQRERPDIIITAGAAQGFWMPALLQVQRKASWIAWEQADMLHPQGRRALLARKFSARYAKAGVFLSEFDEAQYIQRFKPRGETRVLPNPAGLPITPMDPAALFANKTVMAAGRLDQRREFTALLDAWKQLEDVFDDWQLVIAGSGPMHRTLSQQIAKLGLQRAAITGGSEDMTPAYEKASVYCCTAKAGGLPAAAVDALCFGLPIIAPDRSGGMDTLVQHGINGFRTQQNDAHALAELLAYLMSEPADHARLCQGAIASAARFELQTVLDHWERLFEAVKPEPD